MGNTVWTPSLIILSLCLPLVADHISWVSYRPNGTENMLQQSGWMFPTSNPEDLLCIAKHQHSKPRTICFGKMALNCKFGFCIAKYKYYIHCIFSPQYVNLQPTWRVRWGKKYAITCHTMIVISRLWGIYITNFYPVRHILIICWLFDSIKFHCSCYAKNVQFAPGREITKIIVGYILI